MTIRVGLQSRLISRGEVEGVAAGRADGVAGEEAAEIDDVQAIVQVLAVGLKVEGQFVGLIKLSAERGVDSEGGLDASAVDVDAVDDGLAILGQRLLVGAIKIKGQATAIFGAGGNPHTRSELIANAGTGGVALILRVGKVSGELGSCVDRVGTGEQTSGYRKPGIAYDIGIAEKAGEALPVREFELAFSAIEDGFAESDGEADAGVEDLVIVGVVVDVATEIIRVEAELIEEAFRGAKFQIVAVRRFDGQTKNRGLERLHLAGTGKQDVLE